MEGLKGWRETVVGWGGPAGGAEQPSIWAIGGTCNPVSQAEAIIILTEFQNTLNKDGRRSSEIDPQLVGVV